MNSIERASVRMLIDEVTTSTLRPKRRSRFLTLLQKLRNPHYPDEKAKERVTRLRTIFEMEVVSVVSNSPKTLTALEGESSGGSRDVTETKTKKGNETPTTPTKGRKRMATKTPAAKFNEKLRKLKERADNQQLQTKAGGPAIASLLGLVPRPIGDESSTDAVPSHIEDKLTAFENKLKELEVAHGIKKVARNYKKELETEVAAHGETKGKLSTMERDRAYARSQVSRIEGRLKMKGVDEDAQVGKRLENVFDVLPESGTATAADQQKQLAEFTAAVAQVAALETAVKMESVDDKAPLAKRIEAAYTHIKTKYSAASKAAESGKCAIAGIEAFEKTFELKADGKPMDQRLQAVAEKIKELRTSVASARKLREAVEKHPKEIEAAVAKAKKEGNQYGAPFWIAAVVAGLLLLSTIGLGVTSVANYNAAIHNENIVNSLQSSGSGGGGDNVTSFDQLLD